MVMGREALGLGLWLGGDWRRVRGPVGRCVGCRAGRWNVEFGWGKCLFGVGLGG